ncbi:MAG: hypothetical protein QOG64_1654, partial [Acidimicrobiaceae bacterium]|nr:hypothetical protein [Acidimicrobiaceae bacterium]
MNASSHDVLAIGNAIVDVLAHAGDDFVAAQDLVKGSMTLIDDERAEELYQRMGPAVEVSGGSAANTAAGVASFGGRAAFIGKVRDDQLGRVFAHDIRSTGVDFVTPAATAGAATARSFILVTPDAQRTMSTYLGIAAEVTVDDVDEDLVAGAGIVYVEGYLCGLPVTRAALHKAVSLAGRVALTLSDSFWVEDQRDAFVELLPQIDVLFANEGEVCTLYQSTDLAGVLARLAETVPVAAVTRSAEGSIVLAEGKRYDVAAHPVDRVVDTTGAGDLYAAGFL